MAKDTEIVEAIRGHKVRRVRIIASYEDKFEFSSLSEAYGAIAQIQKRAMGDEPLGHITVIFDFSGGSYLEYVSASHEEIRQFIRLFDHQDTIPICEAT